MRICCADNSRHAAANRAPEVSMLRNRRVDPVGFRFDAPLRRIRYFNCLMRAPIASSICFICATCASSPTR